LANSPHYQLVRFNHVSIRKRDIKITPIKARNNLILLGKLRLSVQLYKPLSQ